MSVSYTWCPHDINEEIFLSNYKSTEDFEEKHREACFASLRWLDNAYIVATIHADTRFFKPLVEWIHKQSRGNIQISILDETPIVAGDREGNRYLFSLKVGKAYKEPLTRYITYYLTLVTLRMADIYERYTLRVKPPKRGFSFLTLHKLCSAASSLNFNHALYYFTDNRYNRYEFPKEVLKPLFNVRFFNKIFSSPFIDYYQSPKTEVREVNLTSKVSQTVCMFRILRELRLIEKLDDGSPNKQVLNEFSFIFEKSVYRMVKLDLVDPLYTLPSEKLSIVAEKIRKGEKL